MIIGFSGYAGAGKDTAADALKGGWQIKKFSWKLKQIAGLLLGLQPGYIDTHKFKDSYLFDWGMTGREFLQRLGTDAIRKGLDKDVWVKALFADYTPRDFWVIADVRFPNEAEAIKARGGVIVRINRGKAVNPHESETALDNWPFDYILDNSGTLEDLEHKIAKIAIDYAYKGIT